MSPIGPPPVRPMVPARNPLARWMIVGVIVAGNAGVATA